MTPTTTGVHASTQVGTPEWIDTAYATKPTFATSEFEKGFGEINEQGKLLTLAIVKNIPAGAQREAAILKVREVVLLSGDAILVKGAFKGNA